MTRKINSKTIPSFCNLLKSATWSNVINESDPKIAFFNFFQTMDSVRDLAFPKVKVKSRLVKFKHNPWMSGGLKISKKRKDALFAKKVRCPSDNNKNIFKVYNKLYNKVRRCAKKMYYEPVNI